MSWDSVYRDDEKRFVVCCLINVGRDRDALSHNNDPLTSCCHVTGACCDVLSVGGPGDEVSGVFTRRQDSMVYIRHPDTSSDPFSSPDTPRYLRRHGDYGWVLSSSLDTNNVTSLSKSLTSQHVRRLIR